MDKRRWKAGLLYALAGWLCCLIVMGICMNMLPLERALIVHAAAAPVIFAILSFRYFRKHPSPEPFQTACLFTGFVILMDCFVVALAINRSLAMFSSFVGTWLPFTLIFISTWAVGTAVRRNATGRDG
jgi:uncharacterized membrane protein